MAVAIAHHDDAGAGGKAGDAATIDVAATADAMAVDGVTSDAGVAARGGHMAPLRVSTKW